MKCEDCHADGQKHEKLRKLGLIKNEVVEPKIWENESNDSTEYK